MFLCKQVLNKTNTKYIKVKKDSCKNCTSIKNMTANLNSLFFTMDSAEEACESVTHSTESMSDGLAQLSAKDTLLKERHKIVKAGF